MALVTSPRSLDFPGCPRRRSRGNGPGYVEPMVAEAGRLGIDADALVALIGKSGQTREGSKL